MRGYGRNDYPVEAMWTLTIAGIVFQHPSTQSLLREANRNAKLLEICGFEALPRQGKPIYSIARDAKTGKAYGQVQFQKSHTTVPNSWNLSRFRDLLMKCEQQTGLLSEMVTTQRHTLMDEVNDFGERIGYDGKAIESFSSGRKSRDTGRTSDEDANWGKRRNSLG